MAEFPYNIAINKPIPGERRFKDGVLFEQANANAHHSNGYYPTDKSVEHVGEKSQLIIDHLKTLVERSPDDLDHQ